MSTTHRLGDLQLAIVGVLWEQGEATVADVHGALRDRGLALTTIATMLRKLEDKTVVTHRVDGRQFVYRAAVERRDVHRSMVSDLVDRLFQGDATALVNHLVTEGEIDAKELEEIQDLVDRRHASRADAPPENERERGGR